MEETRPGNPNNKPYPVRFGDLRPLLKMEAFARDISMHSLVRIIVESHFNMIKAHNLTVGKYRKHYGKSFEGKQQLNLWE